MTSHSIHSVSYPNYPPQHSAVDLTALTDDIFHRLVPLLAAQQQLLTTRLNSISNTVLEARNEVPRDATQDIKQWHQAHTAVLNTLINRIAKLGAYIGQDGDKRTLVQRLSSIESAIEDVLGKLNEPQVAHRSVVILDSTGTMADQVWTQET